jgi:hypothetical protein
VIEGLQDQTYDVEFDPTCGGTIDSPASIQWYDDASTQSAATAVTANAATAVDADLS